MERSEHEHPRGPKKSRAGRIERLLNESPERTATFWMLLALLLAAIGAFVLLTSQGSAGLLGL